MSFLTCIKCNYSGNDFKAKLYRLRCPKCGSTSIASEMDWFFNEYSSHAQAKKEQEDNVNDANSTAEKSVESYFFSESE